MSKVFFFDYGKGQTFLKGIKSLCSRIDLDELISKGDSVAIKVSFGELGNTSHLRPQLVRSVVDIIKEQGGKPFVMDTPVIYPGGRGTAKDYIFTAAYNGFVEETVGAPVVIPDDEGVSVKVKRQVEGCTLEEVNLPAPLYNADKLVVLTHAKGHNSNGIGGSIKNMGMGCVTMESKIAQHRLFPLELYDEKCTRCGLCVELCPVDALFMEGETKEDKKLIYDTDKCYVCGTCAINCPSQAWDFPQEGKIALHSYVAHTAGCVLEKFRGNVAFFNFIQDVTPLCDCIAPSGRPIIRDVGILASIDPVAVDRASLDLINKAPRFARPGQTEVPEDLFCAIHKIDPVNHLRITNILGMGSLDYELVKV